LNRLTGGVSFPALKSAKKLEPKFGREQQERTPWGGTGEKPNNGVRAQKNKTDIVTAGFKG